MHDSRAAETMLGTVMLYPRGPVSRRLLLLPLFALTACTGLRMPDAHVPPFAKRPFEPLSRSAVVAVTLREWRLLGQNVADPAADATRTVKAEREQGLWQRVGEYWWLGMNAGS